MASGFEHLDLFLSSVFNINVMAQNYRWQFDPLTYQWFDMGHKLSIFGKIIKLAYTGNWSNWFKFHQTVLPILLVHIIS